MRVGFNLLYLVPGEVGGTEIYARELIGALARARPDDEFVAFCGREAADSALGDSWPDNVSVMRLAVDSQNKPRRLAYELLRLPRVARRERLDVLHSLGQTTPLWSRCARVVTIHDLIFHHFPSTFPAAARRGLEVFVPRGAERADRVVADSEATANDLVSSYGIERDKIDVALLGPGAEPVATPAEPAELAETLGFDLREYALCVASGHRHKNIERLLEAFATVPEQYQLVLVGRAAIDDESLTARVEQLGLSERVRFTGWVDDATLEGLYRRARFFVYPTLMEGFGMPVLEAMRRGLTVACSSVSSMPEVAGDAALLFDPTDTTSIAEALGRLFSDSNLRQRLIAAGRQRAELFSWERTADATWRSYERALEE